jgi:hypothetical protein
MPIPATSPHRDGVLLRTASAEDAELGRLAALDSARPLAGPALVAEENGAIVAALCLSTGRAVADPFVPSLHLVEVLRQHAGGRHAHVGALHGRRLLPHLALRARAERLIGAKLSW